MFSPNCRSKSLQCQARWKKIYHPVKIDTGKYENIRKIATVQGDGYTTGCLLDNVRIRAIFFC